MDNEILLADWRRLNDYEWERERLAPVRRRDSLELSGVDEKEIGEDPERGQPRGSGERDVRGSSTYESEK
ncbi:hypothetical protein CC1G_14041 [Coprinopsis cinerea okayama7|uniref:Uncharacterized protein n=1 Tax=Coprinopsis cinerea (strain Okayama-7 / 130 / ATCC MYA-4618 / FGSC 9003) TaxID=240176 RepID=D6RL17_COPC7|nr:hypothetical protein CC1G_14041 [Coprinopsis cinerea okayama7\|eukprot:XP_002912003.1 hypothetical protein CC1G_14041 [Coprinopsis cinerea okayama7\